MGELVSREASESVKVPDALVRVTITMTRGQHRAIKGLAHELGTSVSELVRMWIAEETGLKLRP